MDICIVSFSGALVSLPYKVASVAHIHSNINKATNFQSIEHVVEACMTTPVLTTIVLSFLLSFLLPIEV